MRLGGADGLRGGVISGRSLGWSVEGLRATRRTEVGRLGRRSDSGGSVPGGWMGLTLTVRPG